MKPLPNAALKDAETGRTGGWRRIKAKLAWKAEWDGVCVAQSACYVTYNDVAGSVQAELKLGQSEIVHGVGKI